MSSSCEVRILSIICEMIDRMTEAELEQIQIRIDIRQALLDGRIVMRNEFGFPTR